MSRSKPVSTVSDDPLWYQKAVIYQLHVRSFFDGNSDGIGDFPGLRQKLDYLQDLGVTAIWMLPFYPSPLRDGGYDISDYMGINPEYGTMRDFRRLVEEAHARGLRVITEVVINHTSDQHHWFQRARHARKGSEARDFYVWTDDPTQYSGARIIFQDFEGSNWTWDPVAKQYYWHRFYHHQPDLNFENPAVHDAVLRVIDFWLDTGVDGLRLDAIPYLYEAEGTNCENLPQTHEYLKKLRAHVDEKFPNRMLLAEANMWPEDTMAYFGGGEGDECHMAFNFPVMPRMYMSVQMEDRYPLVDIMHQTPEIPAKAQWALFLRNHDELTLEMVTDDERDYMYRTYADDPRARINLGIRRRLAPLQKNNRSKVELLNGLLMSLPGTPIIYYGDEIGMGDNIYLGDRDGVRTPMQWSADRNAGFSTANPQQLFLPVIIDPEYRYEAINVATQASNPSSLLVWMRRLISLRKRHPVFGTGELEMLHPDNPKILAFVRSSPEETILVVANLSRFPQAAELDLSGYRDLIPVEVFGSNRFPTITDEPYQMTMAPHSFLWLSLSEPTVDEGGEPGEPPVVLVADTWRDVLTSRTARDAFTAALPAALAGRSWFNPKGRPLETINLLEHHTLKRGRRGVAEIALIEVVYTEGEPETYHLPLSFHPAHDHALPEHRTPATLVVVARSTGTVLGTVVDAVHDVDYANAMLEMILKRRRTAAGDAELAGELGRVGKSITPKLADGLPPVGTRQSHRNSSIVYGDELFLKVFRRVDPGINPEWEVGRYLTDDTSFEHAAKTYGALELQHPREVRTLAVLQEDVVHELDAWDYVIDKMGGYQEDLYQIVDEGRLPNLAPASTMFGFDITSAEQIPDTARELFGPFLTIARTLGGRLSDLHHALAGNTLDEDMKPQRFPSHYQRQLYQSARSKVRNAMRALRGKYGTLDEETAEIVDELLSSEAAVIKLLEPVKDLRIKGLRMRTHGDLHLGQVLVTGPDVVFIDFEGRPTRFISQRKDKRSPLRDLAGLVRSIDIASQVAFEEHLERFNVRATSEARAALERGTHFASSWLTVAMVQGYLQGMEKDLLVEGRESSRVMMRAFLVEKAAVELQFHLRDYPDRVKGSAAAILRLLVEES